MKPDKETTVFELLEFVKSSAFNLSSKGDSGGAAMYAECSLMIKTILELKNKDK